MSDMKKILIKGELRMSKTKLFNEKEILQFYDIQCAFSMFRSSRKLYSVICNKGEVKGFTKLPKNDKKRLLEEIAAIKPTTTSIGARQYILGVYRMSMSLQTTIHRRKKTPTETP